MASLSNIPATEKDPFKVASALRQVIEKINGTPAATGDVVGPGSATDNAVARFDSTTGKLIQNSAFVVDDSGHVTGFGGNIAFPASQAASAGANVLDDYEEGTWTPVLTFTTPGDVSVTYTLQSGLYTKIGRYVMAQCEVQSATFTHTTAASTLLVSGLPFTVANVRTTGPIRWSGINAAGSTDLCCTSSTGVTSVSFLGMAMGAGQVPIEATHCASGGTMVLIFGFPYSV